jgi:hypothetical protein
VVEVRVGYDIVDPQGDEIGSVVQVGRDNLEKTLRPSRDDAAKTELDMCDASGATVLSLMHTQALHSSLAVAAPDGAGIGVIRLTKLLGRSEFTIDGAAGVIGTVKADSWRKKAFVVAAAAGDELARLEMTTGSSGDFSHANVWDVELHQRLEDPLRALAVAAVIAVDMILWER